jgi:hypothetical protein
MEQRLSMAVREKVSLGLAAAAIVVGMIAVGLMVWPRRVGQRVEERKAVGTIASAVGVARPSSTSAPTAREAVRFVEHFCPLSEGGGTDRAKALGSAVRGMVRFQDPVHCFSIEYPVDWRMEDNGGAVHFWAPDTDGPLKDGLYWDADLFVLKPSQTADDERAEYEHFIKKVGIRSRAPGLLVSSWEQMVNGDGTISDKVSQQRKVFSGRGEFGINLQSRPKNAARMALLEKIADSFKAQ